MDFDIQYLLWLQDLRNATGGMFDEVFNLLSKFAVDLLPFLPYVVFWGIDKKWGYRFITTLWGAEVINGIVKLTVCAYRPWIRSELIEPAGDSKVAATGYSFPSGHSVIATTLYGTTFAWQRKKRLWLAVLCGVLTILTCFSRNFLGVHTPQDVVVGFTYSVVLVYLVGRVQEKLGENEKLLDKLTFLGVLVVIAVLIYIQVKPYPMDYVNGELLVDPKIMMKDTFKACGGFLGFLIGSFVERHYIHYEVPTGKMGWKLPVIIFIGVAIMGIWKLCGASATTVALLGMHWGNMLGTGLMVLFAMTLWPLVIRKIGD